jgi:hypothetical protein
MSSHHPDDGGDKRLWNVGQLLWDCTLYGATSQNIPYETTWCERLVCWQTYTVFQHEFFFQRSHENISFYLHTYDSCPLKYGIC